jgi:hypothetical protein
MSNITFTSYKNCVSLTKNVSFLLQKHAYIFNKSISCFFLRIMSNNICHPLVKIWSILTSKRTVYKLLLFKVVCVLQVTRIT